MHQVADGCRASPVSALAIDLTVERAQAFSRMLVKGEARASVDDFLRDRAIDGEGALVSVR